MMPLLAAASLVSSGEATSKPSAAPRASAKKVVSRKGALNKSVRRSRESRAKKRKRVLPPPGQPANTTVREPRQPTNRERVWEQRLKELKAFKKAHGHCRVPISHKTLHDWVKNQRTNLNPESRHCLKNVPERKRRTKKLEPVLGTKLARWCNVEERKEWNEWLEELKAFKIAHGHCKVPDKRKPLQDWLNGQQRYYLKLGHIRCLKNSAERKRRTKELESVLGIEVPIQKIILPWDEHLGELKDFMHNNGHCLVPDSIQPLHEWLEYQCVDLLNATPPMHIKKPEWDRRRKALESVLDTGLDNWKLVHAELKRQVDFKQSHS